VEQLMHWAVHVAGSDKSMSCQERGQRNNFKHTQCTGRWLAPPGALGAQMIRNSIYAHHPRHQCKALSCSAQGAHHGKRAGTRAVAAAACWLSG
jgi:hypothetical protein